MKSTRRKRKTGGTPKDIHVDSVAAAVASQQEAWSSQAGKAKKWNVPELDTLHKFTHLSNKTGHSFERLASLLIDRSCDDDQKKVALEAGRVGHADIDLR